MNKVILMGRLTADPDMRQTPNGVMVANFTIAINRRFAKDETDFIRCQAWRKTAEFIKSWFTKGSMIAVVGSIQTRSWDGKDGKRQYSTEVVVDEVYFTGSKNDSKPTYGQAADGYNQPDKYSQIPSGGADDFDMDGFSDIDGSEDKLPF